ncbi:MAG TPA: hypothetical protein VH599_06465, partial [Ktedonobacterales bacterium]
MQRRLPGGSTLVAPPSWRLATCSAAVLAAGRCARRAFAPRATAPAGQRWPPGRRRYRYTAPQPLPPGRRRYKWP